jgi:ribosomal protein S3
LAIHEIRKAELDAQLVAENVATQLERRVGFRRAMKKAVATAMRFGAKGVRIASKGRLGGAIWVATSGIAKAAYLFTRFALISIMVLQKQRPPMASLV